MAPARADGPAASGGLITDDFWGDTSDIPPAQNVLQVKVLNRTNGAYPDDQVYWTFNGETHSIAEQPYLDMPVNSSGRMYFHLGSPDGPNLRCNLRLISRRLSRSGGFGKFLSTPRGKLVRMANTLVFKLVTVEHSYGPEDGGEATLAASYDRRQCRPIGARVSIM